MEFYSLTVFDRSLQFNKTFWFVTEFTAQTFLNAVQKGNAISPGLYITTFNTEVIKHTVDSATELVDFLNEIASFSGVSLAPTTPESIS